MSLTIPPVKFREMRYHWLHSERAKHPAYTVTGPAMAEWVNGSWYTAGEHVAISPERMYDRGWDYLEPVALTNAAPLAPRKEFNIEDTCGECPWTRACVLYGSCIETSPCK